MINLLLTVNVHTFHHDKYQVVNMDDTYFNTISKDHYFKKQSQSENQEPITLSTGSITTVVFIAPVFVTGGMENLCQFADELKKQGLQVYMLCFPLLYGCLFQTTPNSFIQKKNIDGSWYLCRSQEDLIPEVYKKVYDLSYLDHDIPLDSSTLIVTHEGWCDYLPFFEGAKKMICWLSIGNINGCGRSRSVTDLIDQKCLYMMDCFHTSQAPWVQKTLESYGALVWPLNDYISLPYFTIPKTKKCSNTIAYNPAKGDSLSRLFIFKYSEYNYIKLEKLDSLGIINALDRAQIYIDFGNFPGKDRIPREALLRDCVIFIHNAGCAIDNDSFPVDDYFRFSDQDVIDGSLQKKIDEAFLHWNQMHDKQFILRDSLHHEQATFKSNVQKIVNNFI